MRGSTGFPKSSMPSLFCRIFHIQHMIRRQPCRTAATAKVIQPIWHINQACLNGGKKKPTSPVCALTESDTGDHKDTSRGLNQHHVYT